MTKSLSKVNLASLKVLYTLQLLYERDLSMDELIKLYELYHNEYNTNFVMSKYINTCRYCGIDIKKVNGKYTLLNLPIGISFTTSEINIFKELRNCAEKMKSTNIAENMRNLFKKINKHVDRPINPTTTKIITDSNIKSFEQACLTESKVKILFNDDASKIFEPIDINIEEDHISIFVFDGVNSIELNPDDIKQVKLLPQRSKANFIPTTVLYELKARMAKRYQIRENEQLLKIHQNGDFVISNRFEDKSKLLHRLMRYGTNCKILSPKNYVIDMKNLLDETLKNYS